MHNVGVLAVDVKAVLATVTPIITAYPIRTLLRSAGCLPANAVPRRVLSRFAQVRGVAGLAASILSFLRERQQGKAPPPPRPGYLTCSFGGECFTQYGEWVTPPLH